MRQLYVDKTSGTMADQLEMFGLATVVRDWLRRAYDRHDISVTITDRGGYYQLDLGQPLDDDCLERLREPYMPIRVLVTAKNADGMPPDLPESAQVSYEEQRDRRAQYFELRKNLVDERRQPEEIQERLAGLDPHPDWDIFRAINPAALAGYNKLVLQWWQIQPALAEAAALIRDQYALTPNRREEAEARWKALNKAHGWGISPTVTAGQIFNPSQGKGQNYTKPTRLSMSNVKGFWLSEFLKAVGYYTAALTKQPRGTKDRKTYVLAPLELDLSEHERVFGVFRRAMAVSETPVRLDILVTLRYLQTLLRYAASEEGETTRHHLISLVRPRDAVSGFAGALYKSLGNSQAVMNVPFLGIPAWVQTRSREQMDAMQTALEEHIGIVQQFNESHSDDMNLLLAYRDFSSGNHLEAFFEFAVMYSAFIIGRRERNQYTRQFSEENLGRLIMGTEPKLQPILDNPGFRNIAYAVRQSTVVAQMRKKQGDRRYDVRYGLGQQLARKAHYAEDFIAELSDFLHQYNAENAQVMENRQGPYRRSVRVEDIEEIVRLIDEYGSRTVAHLLIAYGYARAGSAPEGQGDDEGVQLQGDEDVTGDEDGSDEFETED